MALQSDKLRLLRRIPEIRFEEELRGYSKQQVDRVLENLAPLADEIETLQNRLTEAETRAAAAEARLIESSGRESDLLPQAPSVAALPATSVDFDETLRNTLLLAQRTADETVRRANDDAAMITGDAGAEAEQMLSAARSEAAQLDADIQTRRAELLADVDAERRQLLDQIRSGAEARRSAIEQELTQTEGTERAELLSQIEDLQGIRSMLVDDVELLEQHLGQRREVVRIALDEMAAVLDEPDRLRTDGFTLRAAPELPGGRGHPDTSYTDTSHTDTISISVPLLDALAQDQAASDQTAHDLAAHDQRASAMPAPSASAFTDLSEAADEGFLIENSPTLLAAPIFAEPGRETGPATQEISALVVEEYELEVDTSLSGGFDDDPFGTAEPPARPVSRPTWADSVPDADELPDTASGLTESGFAESGFAESGFTESGLVGSGAHASTEADWSTSGSTPAIPTSGGPTSSAVATVLASSGNSPAIQDPFLDQLRRATSEDAGTDDDDALERFLEGDPDSDRRGGGAGGWFGRRK